MTEKMKKNQTDSEIKEISEKTETADNKIGGILKQARLSKGKKIPEVSQILCIRKAYLEAIEANDYEKIPDFPYGIGFIRSYADYLGLNSSLIIQKYKEESEPESIENNNSGYLPEPQTEASVPSKKYLMISLLAIIAVYAGWHFYNNNKNTVINIPAKSESPITDNTQYPLVVEDFALNEGENAAPQTEMEEDLPIIETAPAEKDTQVNITEASFEETTTAPAQIETPQAPAAEQAPAPAEPAQTKSTSAPGKSNIVFQVKKETWLEVKTPDKLYLSKVLYAGDSYTLPKAKGLIVSIGRFDGIETVIDNQVVDFLPKDRKMNINLDAALEKLQQH